MRILEAALELPDAERAKIAALLVDSVGDGSSSENVLASWVAEAKRRSESIRRGEMELVDSDEAIARLRARPGGLRSGASARPASALRRFRTPAPR